MVLVDDMRASNPVLRVDNDNVAIWKFLTYLLNKVLRERLTLLIVGSYDARHYSKHDCADCDQRIYHRNCTRSRLGTHLSGPLSNPFTDPLTRLGSFPSSGSWRWLWRRT